MLTRSSDWNGKVSGSDFRQLDVWKNARDLAIAVYRETSEGALARDFGLRDQMRRAAVSICSNIAEGNERGSDKDTVHFFRIAKGSTAELIAQLDIGLGVGYLNDGKAQALIASYEEIGRMLGGLIKYRERN